jgi:hypothetical protein
MMSCPPPPMPEDVEDVFFFGGGGNIPYIFRYTVKKANVNLKIVRTF